MFSGREITVSAGIEEIFVAYRGGTTAQDRLSPRALSLCCKLLTCKMLCVSTNLGSYSEVGITYTAGAHYSESEKSGSTPLYIMKVLISGRT